MENQDKIIEVLKEKLDQTETKLSITVQDYNDMDIEYKKLIIERDAHLESIQLVRNTCNIEKEKLIVEKNNLENKLNNDCRMLVQQNDTNNDFIQSEVKSSPGNNNNNIVADVDHIENDQDTKKETVLQCDDKIQMLTKEQNLTISSLKQHISIQECSIEHSFLN